MQACDIDLRRELFGNIVLSGGLSFHSCSRLQLKARSVAGNTMFPGIADRLELELKARDQYWP